jgi:hypothetical protein
MKPGDIISYLEMCSTLGVNLQRGMNFRLKNSESVILMSLRRGAPYADKVQDGGRVIIYEGHDVSRTAGVRDPKGLHQPEFQPNGKPTQNGLFMQAVRRFRANAAPPEVVRVFEKIRDGIWAYNGLFNLVDGWQETVDRRQVFKFKLEIVETAELSSPERELQLDHDRVIPSAVKLEVWKRDKGQCVICGAKQNLHFDHVIPYSQGGSSRDPKNVQILCAKHNLAKRDNIQ